MLAAQLDMLREIKKEKSLADTMGRHYRQFAIENVIEENILNIQLVFYRKWKG